MVTQTPSSLSLLHIPTTSHGAPPISQSFCWGSEGERDSRLSNYPERQAPAQWSSGPLPPNLSSSPHPIRVPPRLSHVFHMGRVEWLRDTSFTALRQCGRPHIVPPRGCRPLPPTCHPLPHTQITRPSPHTLHSGPRTYHIPLSPLRAPTQVTWMTSGAQRIHKQLALSVANPPAAMLTVRGVHCFLAENVAGILAPSRGQVSRFGGFSPAALHANHL
jgi:hypothetical protein